jgi:hypothetical protein
MDAGTKFLLAAGWVLSILIVGRLSPGVAFLMAIGSLAVLHLACRERGPS